MWCRLPTQQHQRNGHAVRRLCRGWHWRLSGWLWRTHDLCRGQSTRLARCRFLGYWLCTIGKIIIILWKLKKKLTLHHRTRSGECRTSCRTSEFGTGEWFSSHLIIIIFQGTVWCLHTYVVIYWLDPKHNQSKQFERRSNGNHGPSHHHQGDDANTDPGAKWEDRFTRLWCVLFELKNTKILTSCIIYKL